MAVILIVEDEAFLRESVEWLIKDLGHNTLLASDLASALLHLTASQRIDAMLVDIRLEAQAFGGYDVANQAVGLQPDLQVLYTSGDALTADMKELFVEGSRFLQKPYSRVQLETSVGEILLQCPRL